MKVKFTIIPFIPVALAMIGLKLMGLLGLDSDGLFMGMNKMNIAYVVIGLTLALFLICVIINIFDRKTAPVYEVSKNPIAGIFAVLSGIVVLGTSFIKVVNSTFDSEYYIMMVICALLAIPAAIALILMCKVHFTGKSTVSGVATLYIFPALWGCAELVSEFLAATKVSISSNDMTPLFCYIFLTLYFFSHSMIVSRIKGRNPVKACFIYGLPFAAISLAFGIYTVCTALVENMDMQQILLGAQFVVLGLYALSFLVEMSFGTMTKDEVEIIDGLPDESEDSYENSYVKSDSYDELVFFEKKADDNSEDPDDYISSVEGLDDFVMGYKEEDEEEPIPYLTKEEIKNADSFNGVFLGPDYRAPKAEAKPEPKSETKTESLSDVDMLLKELEDKK